MSNERPMRLHHNAAVVKDLKVTHEFYTGVMGLQLAATWCEQLGDEPFCHAFFELEDGGCLAFFQFANPELYEVNKRPANLSPFHHIALFGTFDMQDEICARAKAAGFSADIIDHGYARSLYMKDPDGHIIEVTVDSADADMIRARAKSELDRWTGGDYAPNNNAENGEVRVPESIRVQMEDA
jgi:glyoxylase I family protein